MQRTTRICYLALAILGVTSMDGEMVGGKISLLMANQGDASVKSWARSGEQADGSAARRYFEDGGG